MLVFGPVPSRRLGKSLGLNMIPPKVCTYSCLYCQVGLTPGMQAQREAFYDSERLLKEVEEKVNALGASGESFDYLTFVPDGEPTLERHLGRQIRLLKRFGRVAVITNASLIWREDVQADLLEADWVSLKVDTVDEQLWHRINRPHRSLRLSWILDGMIEFATMYSGILNTETMLIRGMNDRLEDAEALADFLSRLGPQTTYLSVPTRPPAVECAHPPTERSLTIFHEVLSRRIPGVELLVSYEGNAFVSTGDAEEDLLDIVAVHPMREEAVREFLSKANADFSRIDAMLERGLLIKMEYENTTFYTRPLPAR